MTDRPRDDDLADVAEDLTRELRELRTELERDRFDPPRGPLGLPRPPRPGEFLEFADEVAIPGTIAILEANIKLLEALQRAIRLADSGRRARDRSQEVGSDAAEVANRVGQRTLERVRGGLEDLQEAIESDGTVDDRAGSELLSEIRDLEAEIDERIEASRQRRRREDDRTTTGSVGESANGSDGSRTPDVDVDAELDSLRERYGDDDDEDEGDDRE